jgi:hypothetical protein
MYVAYFRAFINTIIYMGFVREYIFYRRMRPVNCSQFFTLVTCEIGAG